MVLVALLTAVCGSGCGLADDHNDCLGLTNLYFSTNNQLPWDLDTELCGWEGVTCKGGRVDQLLVDSLFGGNSA